MEENQSNIMIQRRRSSLFGLTSVAISDDNDSRSTCTSYAVASLASIPNAFDNGILNTLNHWQILIFGQVLALVLAGIGATSSELHLTCGLSAPTMMLGLMYLLLSLHCIPIVLKHYQNERNKSTSTKVKGRTTRSGLELELPEEEADTIANSKTKQKHTFPFTSIPLGFPWYKYFIVTFIDVESSFGIILAYKYTTFTSITLLGSLAVVGAMITSKIILNTQYQISHFIGVFLCILGIGINIMSDIEDTDSDREYPNKILGDICAGLGGIFIGVSHAMSEQIVKNSDQQQYLGLSGFFGVLICLPQTMIFERENVVDFFQGVSTCDIRVSSTLAIIFAIASYSKFMGDSYFLIISEAALLNLSLLTVDFYSAIFQIFAEQIFPSYKFFLALLMVVSGVFTYEMAPSPIVSKPTLEETIQSGKYNIELKGIKATNARPYLEQKEIT